VQLSQVAGDAVHQAGELIRAETALAKSEFRQEIRAAERGAIVLAVGLVLLQCALLVLAQALILKLGATVAIVAITGTSLMLAAGLCIGLGIAILGRRHLVRTQTRLERDAHTLLEKSHEWP
jgi:VIT1/CCC1 family predicted Fe2+/Mn2+ transporter